MIFSAFYSPLSEDNSEGKKSKNLGSDVFNEEEEPSVEVVIKESDSTPIDGRTVSNFTFENLVKSGVQLDDRKILEETAAELDALRLGVEQPEVGEVQLAEVRLQLLNSKSLEDMVVAIQ